MQEHEDKDVEPDPAGAEAGAPRKPAAGRSLWPEHGCLEARGGGGSGETVGGSGGNKSGGIAGGGFWGLQTL